MIGNDALRGSHDSVPTVAFATFRPAPFAAETAAPGVSVFIRVALAS